MIVSHELIVLPAMKVWILKEYYLESCVIAALFFWREVANKKRSLQLVRSIFRANPPATVLILGVTVL